MTANLLTAECVATSIRDLRDSYEEFCRTHQPIIREVPGWEELSADHVDLADFLALSILKTLPDQRAPYIFSRKAVHLIVAQGSVELFDIADETRSLGRISALDKGDPREALRAVGFIPSNSKTMMKAVEYPAIVIVFSWVTLVGDNAVQPA